MKNIIKNAYFTQRKEKKKTMYRNNKNELTIIINGTQANTDKGFLEIIYEKLNFPFLQHANWDGYLDWMRDLSWIIEENINIIVYNWQDFLSSAKISKEQFVNDLNKIIIPEGDYKNISLHYCDGVNLSQLSEIVEINKILPKMIADYLSYQPEGYRNSITSLVDKFTDEKLSTEQLFELQKLVIKELEKVNVKLDYSEYKGMAVGLPFNSLFTVKYI